MEANGKRSLNTNSNTYIIMYATVMVIAVAFVLAFVSSYLKPVQETNVMLDKKRQILAALNIGGLEDKDVAAKYADVVEADMIIDSGNNVVRQGEKEESVTALPLTALTSRMDGLPCMYAVWTEA